MANRLENKIKEEKLAIESKADYSKAYVTNDVKHLRTLKEAYYQWISRLVILFAVLSLCFFASASLVLFKMAPQVTVEPFLIIKQDNSDSMVRYEVISQNMASKKQLMENFVKQYVIIRNTLLNDEREMQSRWFAGGIVSYLSSPKVYVDFYNTQVNDLTMLLKNGVVRDVEIISVGKVGGEKSPVWKVDFRTYDLIPQESSQKTGALNLQTKYWTASVTAFFVKERMFMARRLINPLGFTVTRYSQTEVEIL